MNCDGSWFIAILIVLGALGVGWFAVSDVHQRMVASIDSISQDCNNPSINSAYCSWNETTQTYRFNMTRFNKTWGVGDYGIWRLIL